MISLLIPSTLVMTMISSTSGFSRAWSLTNAMMASTHVSEPDLMLSRSVSSGTELAMAECSRQFEHDVWNCPMTSFFVNKNRVENNKETAYIHAVVSAGVAHTISRNCSQGGLAQCGCQSLYGASGAENWAWGGCSDNLAFGEQVSRQFLDVDRAGKKPVSPAHLHNNQAGRVAVRKTMRTLCKCHGVSGSCATQTCWRQLGDFQQVGNFLKKQYRQAAEVDLTNGKLKKVTKISKPIVEKKVVEEEDNSVNMMLVSPRLDTSSNSIKRGRRTAKKETEKIKKRKLVFSAPSPDYCNMNPQLGFKGVKGRTCEVDPSAPDQTEQIRKCTNLCNSCGMHARKQVVDVVTSCNCKFEWCCKITCDTCRKKQIRITCTNTPPTAAVRFMDLIQKH